MADKIKVSVSILSADFANLKDEIKKCEDAGVDMIHVDVMDGHFVPPITIGKIIVDAVRPLTKLPIEAHLMVDHPGMHIDDFISAGVDSISLHAECYGKLRPHSNGLGKFPKEVDAIDPDSALTDIKKIRSYGKKVFMTLNPGTPLCINEILSEIDGVLIMSVNPGFAGQKFMPEVLPKISELRSVFDKDISIDGGIQTETSVLAVKAGANILSTASYFFSSKDQTGTVKYLKSLAG
jgi:ribulose-phosphate 3-epimerase